MNPFRMSFACLLLATALCSADEGFVNFETAPVHPIDLNSDRSRLAVCNLADAKLEVFDVSSGGLVPKGSIPVGLDPASVRFRTATEAWVVNHISDSISAVDLGTMEVTAVNLIENPAVEGIIQLRGEVLPVINMERVLGMPPSSNKIDEK